jgi:VCBS repeat-containing protein
VAGVRGSILVVTVGGNGTTWLTNQQGNIFAIAQGVELQIPEGQTCIIISGQPPELIPVNDPPLAEDDAAVTDEDNPVTVAAAGVLDNDADPDVGDTLTVTAVDTSGTVGAVTAWDADGSFTYDPNGQFEYLQAGGSTTDSFTYTVSDGNGGSDTATVTITINGVNDPPVAVDDSATTPEDTPVTIDVLSNDSDIDGDTLTVDSVTQGTNSSVTNNGNNVTYTPDPGFSGTDSFTYTVSDGNGGTDTANVSVNVTVIETPASINVQIDTGPTASIYIWNNTTNWWATDEDTQMLVDGTNHVASDTITVAAGHYYYVWVGGNVTYYAKNYPNDWIITSAPVGDAEAACGYAAADATYPIHFSKIS